MTGFRQQPRAAFLLPTLGGGGAERVVVNLSTRFAEAGHPTDLVLIRAEGPLLAQVSDRVRVVDLEARAKPLAIAPLARYLRRERPAGMLSSMASVNCVAALARRMSGTATRLILSEHSTLSVEVARNWYRRMLPPLMARCYPMADEVVAVSHGVAEDLSRSIGYDRARIAVIHNAVVNPQMIAKSHERPGHPWFEDGEPPVILGVGRLAPQKNFDMLMHAFAGLGPARPCRLLILGEGEDRAALETLARRLGIAGRVQMPGYVANPYAFMRHAAVFVLSSRWEGLPTVLVEAMACGARLVSTDCPSGPVEILQGGALGRLVPVGDVAAMRPALEGALDDPPPAPRDMSAYEAETVLAAYRARLFAQRPDEPRLSRSP